MRGWDDVGTGIMMGMMWLSEIQHSLEVEGSNSARESEGAEEEEHCTEAVVQSNVVHDKGGEHPSQVAEHHHQTKCCTVKTGEG